MSNTFLDFFSNLIKFGGGGDDTALGIDIGSSAIKIVEIKKKGGRALLETYGAIALGPYAGLDAGAVTNLPVDKIAEALKEVIKQSGAGSKSGAFSIPVQSSLIFNLELPASVRESEMPSIVPTEARKYIPVPINEVSLDYFILPEREDSFEEMNKKIENPNDTLAPTKKNVLVVATQNDAVSRYRSIVSECGLSSSFFEIEVFSAIRSNFDHELSPVLLIDFGASRTKLSIVEFGVLKSYHTIDRGGADITDSISKSLSIPFSEAEKMKKEHGLFGDSLEKSLVDIIKTHTDYIFAETSNVLLNYEKKYNRTITKIIFSGGGSLLKGLDEQARNNFKIDIEFGNPFSKVKAPAFLDKVLSTMGPEFAVSIGLALRKLI
jgi:type IV pilus assembly protein PilM